MDGNVSLLVSQLYIDGLDIHGPQMINPIDFDSWVFIKNHQLWQVDIFGSNEMWL